MKSNSKITIEIYNIYYFRDHFVKSMQPKISLMLALLYDFKFDHRRTIEIKLHTWSKNPIICRIFMVK